MTHLTHLLRDADPIRHEVPPRLDAVRERVLAPRPANQPARRLPSVGRSPFLVAAVACAVLGCVASWNGYREGWFVATPVAAQVRFEVRLAEERPVPGLLVGQVGTKGRVIYLHPEIVVDNGDIVRAWLVDDGTSQFSVGVEFTSAAAARLRQATAAHVGRPLALLIDGIVVMAPVLRSPLGESAVVTGQFTRADAERISAGMMPH